MMEEARIRACFAEMPGLHGMLEAVLCGWHGQLQWNGDGTGLLLSVGDFILCGGLPGRDGYARLERMVNAQPRDWLLYAPGAWGDGLPASRRWRRVQRYAFHPLHPGERHASCDAPEGICLCTITEQEVARCMAADWSRDFVREHGSVERFLTHGLGVVAVNTAGELVSGASAYVAWPGGIEVQVQTREDCQGRGLAAAVSARLIELAHRQGRMVSWDAANPVSARLAAKLGFRFCKAYTVWEADTLQRE